MALRAALLALVLLGAGCLAPASVGNHTRVLGEEGVLQIGASTKENIPYTGYAYIDVGGPSEPRVVAAGRLGGAYAKEMPCDEDATCRGDDHSVVRTVWLNVSASRFESPRTHLEGRDPPGSIDAGEIDLGRGLGTIHVSGKAYANPMTGGEWPIRYVMSRFDSGIGTFRDLFLQADAEDQPGPAPVYPVSKRRTVNLVTDAQVYAEDFPNPTIGGVGRVWLNVTSGTPLELRVSVLKPSGAFIRNVTLGVGARWTPIEFVADEFGNYVVRVSGRGAQVEYMATIVFEAKPVTLLLGFDKFIEGEAALKRAQQYGYQASTTAAT